jgi:hypothetical protein
MVKEWLIEFSVREINNNEIFDVKWAVKVYF